MEITDQQLIVRRWLDGDTFDGEYRCMVALPWRRSLPVTVSFLVRVRCWGLNAYEMPSAQGVAACAYAYSLLPAGSSVRWQPEGVDKYGRWLIRVYLDPEKLKPFDTAMIEAGHAVRYVC